MTICALAAARVLRASRPMAALQHVSAALAMFVAVGCAHEEPLVIDAFVDSGKADGGPKKLKRIDRERIDLDEPSDLAFVDGTLYTISDAHSKVYELDLDGDVHTQLDIDGTDFEALAFDGERGEFIVAGERSAKVWHLRQDGTRYDPIDIDADDGNSGIEGLAIDARGHLFVAKEKDPARIFELDAEGNELANTKIEFAADISALALDANDRLYALSDEDHALYRLDGDREVVVAWKLPIEHPEGIAFDGDTFYVVSDSEERLYTFELD